MPQDFRMRSTYGAVAGSTLEDWPISYADMEPWYEKAEREIGVSGDVEPDPFKGPRRNPLPMPPLQPRPREYEILKPAALRLGLHPFDTPLLINSVPAGRPLGLHADPVVRRLRVRDERQERHPQHRDPARARDRATPGCGPSARSRKC